MKYHNILLATAAAGAVFSTATPALARSNGNTQAQQIEILQAQIEALTARLDSQQAVTSQAQQQAQAAQATAAQAVAAASAKPAAPTTDKSVADALKAMAWAKDTKISGRMYFNMSTVNAKNNGVSNEKDGGFQIKRFYIGVDHKFNDMFSGNVTMDIDNVADSTGKLVGKGFYVKKAFLQAKFNKAAVLRLGATDLPWIPYAEGIYGYRHLEKTTTDLFGYGTSSDWGAHLSGDLADGVVSYAVAVVDGAGYRNPQLTKSMDVEGRVSVNYKGFNVAVGGYTGKLGNNTQANQTALTFYRNATRLNALVAYKGKLSDIPFTIGGEYFIAKNWKVKTTAAEDKAEGYSLFASVTPVDKWSIFGRYDRLKPNKYTAPTKKGSYWNAGVQYSPAKIVDLALMYKRYNGDNGFKGGDMTNSATPEATRSEVGLFGQFRF